MVEEASETGDLDIEARQDELLRQLDELNSQVERALAALLGNQANESMAAMAPLSMRKVAQAA